VKSIKDYIPHALQMHRANLNHMANFLALQDAIPSASSHASDIEELGPVDHVIV